MRNAVQTMTNVEPTFKTEEGILELFKKADADNSGDLSRTEFLALYLSIINDRVKGNPLVGASCRCSAVLFVPVSLVSSYLLLFLLFLLLIMKSLCMHCLEFIGLVLMHRCMNLAVALAHIDDKRQFADYGGGLAWIY